MHSMSTGENPLLELSPDKQAELVQLVENGNLDSIADANGIDRRTVLQIGAALSVGSIAGGLSARELVQEARAAADTTDGDGNVGLPGDRVDVFAEAIDSNSVSTEKVNSDPNDSGYNYQDVQGSRSLNTWFTAPSDRDIWVSVTIIADSDNTTMEIIPSVNRSQTQNLLNASRQNNATQNTKLPIYFKVPAGQDYIIEAFQDTASYSINSWVELR